MPGHRAAHAALTALIVAAGLVRIGEAAQAPALDVVLDRLSAYLRDYETKVIELAADEQYKQWIKRRSGYGGDTVSRRNLKSMYFLVRLPDGRAWFGFRDVTRVDGRDVSRQGRPMEQVLGERTSDAYDEALAIMRENAKYNIGDVYRTINLPLQALDLLHPQHRDRFDFKRRDASGSEAVRRPSSRFKSVQCQGSSAMASEASFSLTDACGLSRRRAPYSGRSCVSTGKPRAI